MKWKYFLTLWLVIFLLAPSIWIHRLLLTTGAPPGSGPSDPALFIPFGGIYFIGELWGQLIAGDFMDALMIFLFLILPILIYTFIVSLIMYYLGRYFLRKIRDKRREKELVTP
jgi:hypothetical protein